MPTEILLKSIARSRILSTIDSGVLLASCSLLSKITTGIISHGITNINPIRNNTIEEKEIMLEVYALQTK
jgi:hypothetical protein